MISVEVDDKDPKFAADLANAHEAEVTKLLGRLAVSEAQLRRVFFEKQLQDTKENLVKAEQSLQAVQEKSGVIVLDKQAEALITSAALLRAQISEREVQLKVLRTSATEQNPAVMRLNSELRGLRAELARMESSQGGAPGSAVDLPVGRIPEAAVDYVRARRELKLQETLLEGMVRQYEIAKLDEAKEGPALQQVDVAVPPDRKSRPSRALIVLTSTLLALLLVSAWVVVRRYVATARPTIRQRRRHGAASSAPGASGAEWRRRGRGQRDPAARPHQHRAQGRRRIGARGRGEPSRAASSRVMPRLRRLDRDAARRQRIARVLARPLDPERHRPGRRPAAVAGQRDAPAQHAVRRHPLGGDDAAGIGAAGTKRGDGGLDVVAARDPVNETRGGDRCLQRRVVEIEPARLRRRRCLGIDRDQLEVSLRVLL